MQDKDMVNDVLSQINSSLTGYSHVITQSSNPQFRQTIQQIRNNCETFQYELYKMAEQKGYYKPAQMANMNEVQQVRSLFQ
jgi:spore coat protein CotF